MFTDEEINDMIAEIVSDKLERGEVCPGNCRFCESIFPRIAGGTGGGVCPCDCYSKKYVIAKFWRAMERKPQRRYGYHEN